MQTPSTPTTDSAATIKLVAAWLLVGIPLAWGIYRTALNASALFK